MTVSTPTRDRRRVSVPQPRGGDRPWVDVAVASDLSLVAEAVSAALRSRRIRVSVLVWPRVPRDDPVHRQLARLDPDVTLLLYDVDTSIRMAEADALMRGWGGPWLVLTGSAPGAAWGGLRSAGAAAVRASTTGLDEVETLTRLLAKGARAPGADSLDEDLERWEEMQVQHAHIQRRLDSLTPRELQVLDMLCKGIQARQVAVVLGLSESTVRSQIRSVLAKLEVRSQLAAVATIRAIDGPD